MLNLFFYKLSTQTALFRSLAKNPKFWLILSIDLLLLILAHYLAYAIRFADVGNPVNLFKHLPATTVLSLPVILIFVKIPVFYCTGLYRGMWRYTSYTDIINILKGTVYSVVIVLVFLLFFNRLQGYSRSIFILDSLLTFFLITGHRVAIRFLYKNIEGPRQFFLRKAAFEKKRLLLVGAGSSADIVIREIQSSRNMPYIPVGLVDDDTKKIGLKIHGIPVIGVIADLNQHIHRTEADEILIAISVTSGSNMKRIVDICRQTGLPFKVLPPMGELLNGKVSIKAIRDISYIDLLGREPVRLEQQSINNYLTGKTILVTGAGGSIGSELCKQIIHFSPKEIILYDAGEENLYTIEMKLRLEQNFNALVPVLGKVQDQALLERVFTRHKPTVVFHAAAYKHVPLIEKNPWQAINNNVFAAQLLIETSIIHKVDRFVLVSTDKAVRPTNVMGASKRLTELLMLAYNSSSWDGCLCPARERIKKYAPATKTTCDPNHTTIFMAVRFGNVLGSSGSVIPLFTRQIQRGGPVTVTHPEVCRYFMSIEEATQLILQAGAMGKGGEIFLLKMGKPVKIAKMARDLIQLAGREPDTEIEIQYTGLRDGEKLVEELITEGEGIIQTEHDKIMVLRGNSVSCAQLQPMLEKLLEQSREHNEDAIKKLLQEIIPEYNADYKAASINKEMTNPPL